MEEDRKSVADVEKASGSYTEDITVVNPAKYAEMERRHGRTVSACGGL